MTCSTPTSPPLPTQPRGIRAWTVAVLVAVCTAVTAAGVWLLVARGSDARPGAAGCGRDPGRAGAAETADCVGKAIEARDADAICELSTVQVRDRTRRFAPGGPDASCAAATRRVLSTSDATPDGERAVDAWGRSFRDSPVTMTGGHGYVRVLRASGRITSERFTYEDGHWRLDLNPDNGTGDSTDDDGTGS